jgi:uncharacterized protein YdaU (DUF1376 family)
MTKRKDAKPARLRWFALDVDAFFDDDRTRRLTTREKSFWLMICARSFRSGGRIFADADTIADDTGATTKEAEKLIIKLLATGLLQTEQQNSIDCYSPRMVAEYDKARKSYTFYADLGSAGGTAKAIKRKLIEGSVR